MPAIIKPTISSEIAKIYQKAIESQTTNAYFMLGKITPWTDSDLGGSGIYNDTTPPTPRTSEAYENETRRNIVSLQKATVINTSLATKRYDWVSGTVYDMYDPRYSDTNLAPSGATNLAQSKMFILTDEFNLYKCIDNNNRAASTVKPTGTSTSYVALSDGYVWKYMKTVSIAERNQFLSAGFVPVSDVVAAGFYDGEIGFTINDGGSGYAQDNTVLTVSGDGTGADLQAVVTSGSISNVVVNDGGTGYTSASIDITTPDPAKAQGINGDIDAVINQITTQNTQTNVQLAAVNGEISTIIINSGGSGYVAPVATITGDGTGAAVTPILSSGVIIGFTFSNRGSGYTFANITITDTEGSEFDGSVIVAPPNGHGFSLINESYPTAISALVTGIDALVQTMDVTAEYRQLGIIIDPVKYNANNLDNYVEKITATTATPCYLITKGSIDPANYTVAEKLLDSASKEYLVVAVESGKILVQALEEVEPAGGLTLTTQGVPPVSLVIDSDGQVTDPTFDRNTGSMFYIDNRVPFSKGANQLINIRTFIEF